MEQNRLKFYRKEIKKTNGAKILINIATIKTLIIVVKLKMNNKEEKNTNNKTQLNMVQYIEEYEK